MSSIDFYILVEPDNQDRAKEVLSRHGDFNIHGIDEQRGLFEFGVSGVELDGGDGFVGADALKKAGIPFSAYWTRPELEPSGHGEIHYRVDVNGDEKYIELGGIDGGNVPGVVLGSELAVDYEMLAKKADNIGLLMNFVKRLTVALEIPDFSNGASMIAGELAGSIFIVKSLVFLIVI